MAESNLLARTLAATLSAQLQAGTGAPSGRRPLPTTVAFVPLEDGLPLRELGQAVFRALSGQGSAAVLNRIGSRSQDPLADFAPLLDSCERDNEHVLLLTDRPDRGDSWTRFSLSAADRIIALTSGGPVASPPEALVALRGCDLALVDSGARLGLESWIAALEPAALHRLEPGANLPATAELMARRLAGRSLGLVLAGGGARAFAHLGVLEELRAAGVQVDRVAGVSMGAFIGGQLAAGRELEEIDACCYDEWVRRNPINDYTFPRKALIRGQKGAAMVRRVFGELMIEELPKPFYCASTDIRRGELVLHRSGSMTEAVLASVSLPILTPPRILDGRALIDGSLLDNMPVAPMAASGEGPVLAIDIKPRASRPARPQRPRPVTAPAFGETLGRVLQLASADTTQAAAVHADAVIRVGVEGVGLLEFHQIDAAREAGRLAGREALERGLLAVNA
jgi:predicted acylesterase/phospholipase RssA